MGITSTADFGPLHHSSRDPEIPHVLTAELGKVEGEDAGITGGMTEKIREAEAERTDNLPVVGPTADYLAYNPVPDPTRHEVDTDFSGTKEVPRHDRYADENTPEPTPDRVVPSGPTNANPSFADYEVAVQDQPGAAADAEVTFERPDVVAGEGAWEVRETTEEATGVTSPVGDEHNDPEGERAADTKDEADALAAEHGGTIKDFGDPPIPVAGEGSEPPDQPEPTEEEEEPAVEPEAEPVKEDEPVAVPVVEVEAPVVEEPEKLGPPAHSALKAEWVDYVTTNYEMSVEDAEAMTKAELIETYGG